MLVTNNTANYYYLGDADYALPPGGAVTVPDNVYNSNDDVADAINQLDEANSVTVSSAPSGYPRTIQSAGGGGGPEDAADVEVDSTDLTGTGTTVQDVLEELDEYNVDQGGGMRNITILPYLGMTVVAGTLSNNKDDNALSNGQAIMTTQNTRITFSLWMDPGTWELALMVTQLGTTGICTVKLDGSTVGTMDTYQAGFNYNIIKTLEIPVLTSGWKVIELTNPTKNGSSSGYGIYIQLIGLKKTA